MFRKFKSALQILIIVALAVQLAGCFYERRDDRRHNDREEYHDYDRGGTRVDVHL